MIRDIEKKIYNIIKSECEIESEFTPDDNLFDLGMDSLTTIKLVVAIEEEFDIEFDDEYLNSETLSTLKSIVQYVNSIS